MVSNSDPSIAPGDMATTGGIGEHVYVKFSMVKFTSGQADIETTGCHELVHAYFRKWMSARDYDKVPRWFREGSAVYLSGQLQEKINMMMFRDSHSWQQVMTSFNGLEGPHSYFDYLEYAFAFDFLDSKKPGTVVEVLKDVMNGVEVYQAIQKT